VKTLANFAAAGWQLCKAQGIAEPIASSMNRVNSRSIGWGLTLGSGAYFGVRHELLTYWEIWE
jgi:hypothetical protein